jgi:hypothetical protein
MVLDITGIYFFMPVFSFLFVFVVVYAVLAKTKVLGDQRVNLLVSFIIAIIFMNFSSLDLYVRTILPWFVVLLVCLFLVLVIIGFSTKDYEKLTTPGFAWVVVAILIVIFLIAAIRVFNPMFHPELGITTAGDGQEGVLLQMRHLFDSQVSGSVLLLILGLIVAWILTKK